MMTPVELERLRLQPATTYNDCVYLGTSLVRADLFTWLEENQQRMKLPDTRLHISTWQIDNHPAPDGSTFTLYAMTVVLLPA